MIPNNYHKIATHVKIQKNQLHITNSARLLVLLLATCYQTRCVVDLLVPQTIWDKYEKDFFTWLQGPVSSDLLLSTHCIASKHTKFQLYPAPLKESTDSKILFECGLQTLFEHSLYSSGGLKYSHLGLNIYSKKQRHNLVRNSWNSLGKITLWYT